MIFIDSNIVLDVVTKDANWFDWSSEMLSMYSETDQLVINAIVYAEISINFNKIEDLNEILDPEYFELLPITPEVSFLAGKAFLKYRKNNGHKNSCLPDFFIGAHAAILGIPLLTRDLKHYKTYFPNLKLIYPETELHT